MPEDDRQFLFDKLPEGWEERCRAVRCLHDEAMQDCLNRTLRRFPRDDATIFALLDSVGLIFAEYLQRSVEHGFVKKERVQTMCDRIAAYALKPPGTRPS